MTTTNPNKAPCWLSFLILSGLGISASPHQVLTRTSEVSRVLSPVLSSYEVIRTAPGEIERQVRTTGELRFRFNQTDFYFNLEPHDMRAPNYRAVETGPGGVRRTLSPQPVHTFKGVLAGREDTRGRFNLTDGGVEGVVYAPEGWVYVEPLRNYLPSATAGELVVYSHADIKPGEDFKCGVSLPQRLQRGVDRVVVQAEAAIPTNYNYIVEVATEADYEYVQALGGSVEANREIESILNQVDGVYQSELSLRLRLVFQNTWATEENPYAEEETASAELRLKFQDYWEANFAAEVNYNLAHLWTGKRVDFFLGLAGGWVCDNTFGSDRGYAYSVRVTHPPVKYTLPAHEIGHNFGAGHPDEVQGCTDTIMTQSSPGFTFCEMSRQEIATHLAHHNSCLSPQLITLESPTEVTAVAISSENHSSFDFAITLTWRDNSANETGFVLERRLDAEHERPRWHLPNWASIATTPKNVTIYTDTGLKPATGYHYRVRAFNDTESSVFSNAVLAGTPGIQPPTQLKATLVSNDNDHAIPSYNIDLSWQDNSYNEAGFIIQRRLDDSPDWVSIAFRVATFPYFTDVGLRPAAGYHYRVRAFNGTESSAFSNDVMATTLGTQPPTGGTQPPKPPSQGIHPPTELAATTFDNSRIHLSWLDNSTNETGCIVERRLDGEPDWISIALTDVNVSVFTDTGLRPSTVYHYRVRAFNDTESSDFSNEVTATTRTTSSSTEEMEPPTPLYATAFDNSRIFLEWFYIKTHGTETGFIVQRRLDASPDWVSVITTPASFVSEYTDTGLSPATTYHYRVRAFNDSDLSGFSNEAKATTLGTLLTTEGIEPPTGLSATPVSISRANLKWEDNSTNETGFRILRRPDGTGDWVVVGTTVANATNFFDVGLLPGTVYHYRVQAFNDTASSAFSNEASATILGPPPTLTRFEPTNGPVGRRVTLTGTGFLDATAVAFNGVSASEFEIVSGTSIEVIVPPGATSGPISVVAPGGTVTSAESFTVTTGILSRLFVPIVLRSQGRTPGSFFTSELTLTNRGSTTAAVHYTYTAAFGRGSGTAVDSLEPGRQRVIPDAIAYLTSLGVPIGEGAAGGTLVVDFSNLSSPSDAAVTVRVSTPVEDGSGRAGLAYLGLNPDGLLNGPAFITGLRQNSQDRSNVAVQNAGVAGEESITLRVTVFPGDPASAVRSMVLPDLTLPPGAFYQYNRILSMAGIDNGYVRVERVSGAAPFYAYGVINDNFNSDGSFVFPVRESSLVGKRGQTLPVIIETGTFNSELTVTNFSASDKTVKFSFVAEAIATDDDTATFSLKLKAGEQQILPQIVNWLRQDEDVAGIGPANRAFVGAVFATVAKDDMSGIVIGARTGSPGGEGQYGVFYNAVPSGSASIDSAWIYGLQQNEENRSNLALVNTGEIDDSPSTFEIDVYDGDDGGRDSQVRTVSEIVGPRRWVQLNGILGKTSQGYVQVRKTSGNNPFITYGVINDGSRPGQRSGDGAFLSSQE